MEAGKNCYYVEVKGNTTQNILLWTMNKYALKDWLKGVFQVFSEIYISTDLGQALYCIRMKLIFLVMLHKKVGLVESLPFSV